MRTGSDAMNHTRTHTFILDALNYEVKINGNYSSWPLNLSDAGVIYLRPVGQLKHTYPLDSDGHARSTFLKALQLDPTTVKKNSNCSMIAARCMHTQCVLVFQLRLIVRLGEQTHGMEKLEAPSTG